MKLRKFKFTNIVITLVTYEYKHAITYNQCDDINL